MSAAPSPAQILLAEDNPADVRLVREALSEHAIHCDLRVIADGEQAIDFINKLDLDTNIPCPDLLLLDLHLPKYDGTAVLRRLRASERCGQTPVVVLTSSDAPRSEQILPVKYFQKPLRLRQFMQLGAVVQEMLNASQCN